MPVSLRQNPLPSGNSSKTKKNHNPRNQTTFNQNRTDFIDPTTAAANQDLLENVNTVRLDDTRELGMRRKPVVVSVLPASSSSARDGTIDGHKAPTNDGKSDCQSDGVGVNSSEAEQSHQASPVIPVNGLPHNTPATAAVRLPGKTSHSFVAPSHEPQGSSTKAAGSPAPPVGAPVEAPLEPVRLLDYAVQPDMATRPTPSHHHYAMTSHGDPSAYVAGGHAAVPALNQRPTGDLQQQQQQQQQYLWFSEEAHRIQQANLALSELALGHTLVAGAPQHGHAMVAGTPQFHPESTVGMQFTAVNPSLEHQRLEANPPFVSAQTADDRKVAPTAYLPTAASTFGGLPVNNNNNGSAFQTLPEMLPYGFHSTSVPYGLPYPQPDHVMLGQHYCMGPAGPLACDLAWSGPAAAAHAVNGPPGYWFFPQQHQAAGSQAAAELKAEPQPAVYPATGLHRSGVVEQETGLASSLSPVEAVSSGQLVNGCPPGYAPQQQWLVNATRPLPHAPPIVRPLPAAAAGWSPTRCYSYNMARAAAALAANLTNSQHQQALVGHHQQQHGLSLAQYRALLLRMPPQAAVAINPAVKPLSRVLACCRQFDAAELRSLNLQVNPSEFDESLLLPGTRYFVIKSDCEDNVHQSIRHGFWCSTRSGNQRLNEAYQSLERHAAAGGSSDSPAGTDLSSSVEQKTLLASPVPTGRILFFFSVRSSGFFAGVAEMIGPVETNVQLDIWRDTRFRGKIPVRWLYVKNVPNQLLRHICVESYENRSVTLLRDTSEVLPASKGEEMLRIIHSFDQPPIRDVQFTTGHVAIALSHA